MCHCREIILTDILKIKSENSIHTYIRTSESTDHENN